jgi:hypothetical protein
MCNTLERRLLLSLFRCMQMHINRALDWTASPAREHHFTSQNSTDGRHEIASVIAFEPAPFDQKIEHDTHLLFKS